MAPRRAGLLELRDESTVVQLVIRLGRRPNLDWRCGHAFRSLLGCLLFQGGLDDKRRAQARLLAPIGRAIAVHQSAGTRIEKGAVTGPGVQLEIAQAGHTRLVLRQSAVHAAVRLVSTSNEAFSSVRVWLIQRDGSAVPFPTVAEISPRETHEQHVYFLANEISGHRLHLDPGLASSSDELEAAGPGGQRVGRPGLG